MHAKLNNNVNKGKAHKNFMQYLNYDKYYEI